MFELPLLNTVNEVISNIYTNVAAVWVGIPLYMLNLSLNLVLFLLLLVPHILTPMTWQEIKFKLNKTYTTIGWPVRTSTPSGGGGRLAHSLSQQAGVSVRKAVFTF